MPTYKRAKGRRERERERVVGRLGRLGGDAARGAAEVAAQNTSGRRRDPEGPPAADVARPEVVDLADLLLGEQDDGVVVTGSHCETLRRVAWWCYAMGSSAMGYLSSRLS